MPRLSVRKLAIAAGVVALLACWLRGYAQDAKPAALPAQPGQPIKLDRPYYYGNAMCAGASCHELPMRAEPKAELVQGGYTLLSARNELTKWQGADKHQIATSVLTQELGQKIAKALGITGDIADPQKNAQWRQCLSCHGVVVEEEALADPRYFSPDVRVANGVSCVVCHGAHKQWVDQHYLRGTNPWETLTRTDKKAWGLRDLWDPVERARLCCSCHVGNASANEAENKVVTHAMYAAGHPPLPSFEMVTYTEAMPQHWQTVQEKEARLPRWGKEKTADIYAKLYGLGDAEQQQLELLSASAITALRQSAQVIAAYADEKMPQGKQGAWPEFALYDCYACHHDLKEKSWRQERDAIGKPGRPQMPEWPRALLPLALELKQPEKAADLMKAVRGLRDVFGQKPFGGEPAEVLPAARAVVGSCEIMLKQLKDARLNREEALRLRNALLKHCAKKLVDFDSARQVIWTLEVLDAQAHAKLPAEPINQLTKPLNLRLPGGKEPLWPTYIRDTMTKRAGYNATMFRESLQELQKSVNKQPAK